LPRQRGLVRLKAMNTGRARRISSWAYWGVPAWLVAATVLHAAACGGAASAGSEGAESEGPATALPPVVIPGRAEPPAASSSSDAEPSAAAPAPASSAGTSIEAPAPVRAILDDLPEQLNAEQFETLFDHYCVSCHTTPACSAACDGFFFDSWEDLAVNGGNSGPDSAGQKVEATVRRMNEGSMPPALDDAIYGTRYDLPSDARDSMVEFILEETRQPLR
jgi:hypothetical protein